MIFLSGFSDRRVRFRVYMKNQRWLERRKDIPNFKYFGFLNNVLFALKKLMTFHANLFCSLFISGVLMTVYSITSIYIPKIIIELIERGARIERLLFSVALMGSIIYIANYFDGKIKYGFEWRYKQVALGLNSERLEKSLRTDLANMETPMFLDIQKRAERATQKGFGFYGIYNHIPTVVSQLLLVVISAISIVTLNVPIVLILGLLSFVAYKILELTMEEDKVKHNDVLAPIQRRINYLDKISRDNEFAKDICLYSMGGWLNTVLSGFSREYIETFRKHHNRWIRSDVIMNGIIFVQSLVVYSFLLYRVFYFDMSAGDFVLFLGLINTFTKSLTDFFWTLGTVNKNSMDINDYRSFLLWPEMSKPNEKTVDVIADKNPCFEFEHVSFRYPGHEKDVIHDLNLKIDVREKLAVVGVNGAGKSTFVNLLLRLYEPTDGRILMNGTDIREFDKQEYQRLFAPVFQNVEYFALPIWENISMKSARDTNQDVVDKCISDSGLADKISKLQSGKDTQMRKVFYHDGIELSGGEKQRLAMARALYKEGEVLVLDEPTAALDALAEDGLYREFNSLTQNKMAVFISHRLASTRFCDHIVFFENGRIVEQGTHDELLKMRGKYAQMYEVQAKYYRDEGKDYAG